MGSVNPKRCQPSRVIMRGAMPIYHLNHRYVGKTSSEPGTAAAKVRYMVRAKACEKIVTVGLSTHPKALERAANENERQSRKNARVCDTFHIALPKEMSAGERIATTQSFLWQLTEGGQARAFAAFHGGDTINPHLHVMFFDRNPETGKRVRGMSERGSTEKVRMLWENVCNAKLEEFGYEERIDRRTLEAQREERDAQLATPERPDLPLETDEASLSPDDMAYIPSPEDLQPHERVENALAHDGELQYLRGLQKDVEGLKADVEQHNIAATRHAELAKEAQQRALEADRLAYRHEQELAPLVKPDGSFKGFRVGWRIKLPFIGDEFKSPTRKRAEYHAEEKQHQEWTRDRAKFEAKAARDAVQLHEEKSAEAAQQKEIKEAQLRNIAQSFGDDATLDVAGQILENSIQHELEQVTPEEVYSDFENGSLDAEQAKRAFELMNQPAYIALVEAREQYEQARADEGLEI